MLQTFCHERILSHKMHFMNIFVCDVYKHLFPPRNVSLLFGLVQNPLEDSYIIHSIKHSGQFNIINKRQKYYDIQAQTHTHTQHAHSHFRYHLIRMKELKSKTTNRLIKSAQLLQKSENRITNCPNLIR